MVETTENETRVVKTKRLFYGEQDLAKVEVDFAMRNII